VQRRITNEENYVAQKFARAVIGNQQCRPLRPSLTLFHGGRSGCCIWKWCDDQPIGDIEKSEVILVTGSNTTENHPVLSSYVKRAVTQKGAKLIVVDPRRIPLVNFANLWLRQNLETDVAWINGMMHVIIKEGLYDEGYVGTRTVGIEDVKKVC